MKELSCFYKDKGQKSNLTPSCKSCLYNAQPVNQLATVKEKLCPDCNQLKPSSDFRRHTRSFDGLQTYCKTDENQRKNASKYKMAISEYRALLLKGCEACGGYDRLCVDHDHSCCPGSYPCGQCNRGVLCHSCNFVEGRIKTRAQLFGIMAYKEKHGML